jgi:hypothetical protein
MFSPVDSAVTARSGSSSDELDRLALTLGYGHLFAQDRAIVLDAMNQAVTRLYAYEDQEPGTDGGADAAA